MLARDLIDRLERQGLLDAEVLDALRHQLDQLGGKVTPEAVAKLLVDNGHLTRFQATKLIGELRAGQYESTDGGSEELTPEEEELQLRIDEADSGELQIRQAESDPTAQSALLLDDDDDDEVVEAVPVAGEPIDAEPIDAEPIDAEPVDAEPFAAEAVPVGGPTPVRKKKTNGADKPKKSQWDSFRIYGVLAILLIVCVVGSWLFYSYTRGSAAEFLARGDKMYSSQNYESAIDTYENYLYYYSGDEEKESLARVRIILSQLFDAKRKYRQPSDVTKLAKELLPKIESETALSDARADLAGFLVDLAEDIAARADAAEDTDEKEQLVKDLDSQLELVASPTYLTSSLRQTLQNRINAVREDRQRVMRDINRNRELVAAVEEMKQRLEDKETKQAYDIRKQLVRRYPQLLDNEQLSELVLSASDIQKQLVDNGGDEPEIATEELDSDVQRTVVLANRMGDRIPELAGKVVFARSRGSVIALDAENGSLKWRRFVGYRDDYPPIALGDEPEDGVLLSDGQRLEVQKLDGTDGSIQWRAKIGETFNRPIVSDGLAFVATHSGRLIVLDHEKGRTEWVSEIPQNLEVGPLLADRVDLVYQTGDHSNLYVLDRDNGSAAESYYVGHEAGTVRVPPVFLLNHLFVFSNPAPDFSLVHILRTDDEGRNLRKAQNDVRLDGNIVVSPQILDRRVIILTDRGQVVVLDIEPTAEGNQVSQVAELVASSDSPTPAEMEVDRGEMWVASDQLQRYELQINTGRVVPQWVKHKEDGFTAAPQLMGETLLTTRVVRGTQGVRVAALDPKTGETRWQTDVGVPTALAAVDPETNSIYAVTSQAALYLLDREAITSGATTGPIENPGGSGRAMRFSEQIDLGGGSAALMNAATPGQIAIFAPERERQKLRLVTLAIPGNAIPQTPIASGGGLFVPLSTGRIMLLDYRTGSSMASPFQPPTEPGAEVKWTAPVTLPDDPDQVVIGDSRGKVYRLRAGEQLRSLAEADLPRPILGPAAAFDDAVLLLAEGVVGDALLILDARSLEVRNETALERKVTWGPYPLQDDAIYLTDDSMLHRINSEGEEVWQSQISTAVSLSRNPVTVDESLMLLDDNGGLLNLDPVNGELQGQLDIGQPIGSEPIGFGKWLLVPGDEGTLYVVDPPEA